MTARGQAGSPVAAEGSGLAVLASPGLAGGPAPGGGAGLDDPWEWSGTARTDGTVRAGVAQPPGAGGDEAACVAGPPAAVIPCGPARAGRMAERAAGGLGGRAPSNRLWWLLLVCLVLSAGLALLPGPAQITWREALAVLTGWTLPAGEEVPALRASILLELRLPRLILAMAAGAGLALAGAVMQALTRNPLADPYLLGLSSGAALGAVLALLAGAALLVPVAAFLGSLGALSLSLGIAALLGGASPARAILAGICISALASAATSGLIFWTATGDSYRDILAWLMGSLAGSSWGEVQVALAALALCAPVILLAGRSLDAFAFGELQAASLGVDVARLRWGMLIAAALLTGVMVAFGGAIGFVGLVVPQAVRLITGPGHRRLLPATMLLGALFLLWADTAARSLFAPRELPVGILTALVGAPVFFLVLLRFRRQI